jgi:hypothetical protein
MRRWRGALHARAAEDQQAGERGAGDGEGCRREVVGVEQRDDHDRTNIVQDGERHQEHLEPHGHAVAEERKHAEREGDVGGRGNRPALRGERIAPVEPKVDRGGQRHPARRRERGEHPLRGTGELACLHLAREFQPDEEEEHRHQPVVDPQEQRLGDVEAADPHLDGGVEEAGVGALEG